MFQTRWMLQTRIKNRLIRRGIVALALLATLSGAPVAAGQTFDEAEAVQRYRKALLCRSRLPVVTARSWLPVASKASVSRTAASKSLVS